MRCGFVFIAAMTIWLSVSEPCHASGLLTRPQVDSIQVIGEGPAQHTAFALVFDRPRAGISGWYNLDLDPRMQHNLAPVGSTWSSTLFHIESQILLDGKRVSIGPGPAWNMSLVESLPERVVISYTGTLIKLDGNRPADEQARLLQLATGRVVVGDRLPDCEIRYTIYPTGAVFVHLAWDIRGTPLTLLHHHAVLATAPSDQAVALNDCEDPDRAFTWPASFILHHGSAPDYPADALLAVHSSRFPTDWFGQGSSSSAGKTGWFRSAFNLLPSARSLPQGHYTWDFLLHVEPGSAGKRAAAFDLSEDYRHPASLRLPDERWGRLDVLDPGDADSNGFSERDGTYNLISGPRGVRFIISSETYPRVCPAFRVSDWRGPVPDAVLMDDNLLSCGKDYSASVTGNVLLVQYLGVIRNHRARFEFIQTERR